MTVTRVVVAMGVLALCGCTSATDIYTANGHKAKLIECDGIVQSMSDCFKKAAEVCPAGYRPVGSAGEAYPIGSSVGTGSAQVAGSSGWAQAEQTTVVGTAVYRYLTVECNGPTQTGKN